MRSRRLTLILISVLAILLCVATMASTAVASSARPRTVVFDAMFTAQRTAGPDASNVGHRQIASGVLLNSTGRAVGRFAFTCTWVRILAGGDALERCSGFGRTADGRLEVAGPSRESEAVHSWKLTGESGAYRGAQGTVLVRDIGARESLITATVTPRPGTVLRVAVVVRPACGCPPHRPRRSDLHSRVSAAGALVHCTLYVIRLLRMPASSSTPIRSALARLGSWRRSHRSRCPTLIRCIPIPRCCPRSARSSPARVTLVQSFKP